MFKNNRSSYLNRYLIEKERIKREDEMLADLLTKIQDYINTDSSHVKAVLENHYRFNDLLLIAGECIRAYFDFQRHIHSYHLRGLTRYKKRILEECRTQLAEVLTPLPTFILNEALVQGDNTENLVERDWQTLKTKQELLVKSLTNYFATVHAFQSISEVHQLNNFYLPLVNVTNKYLNINLSLINVDYNF